MNTNEFDEKDYWEVTTTDGNVYTLNIEEYESLQEAMSGDTPPRLVELADGSALNPTYITSIRHGRDGGASASGVDYRMEFLVSKEEHKKVRKMIKEVKEAGGIGRYYKQKMQKGTNA